MLRELQLKKSELSILLTDDDQIQRLNRLYRNIDRPTDVLSFSQRQGDLPDHPSALLGDVVISTPTAERQAIERGHSVAAEVTRLLAHGLLHLMGWDHVTPAQDRSMRRETGRLCAAAAAATEGARVAHVNREAVRGGNGQSGRRTVKVKGVK
jgi:probable rRNA maturation factor